MTDNQHRQIKGYRDFGELTIANINSIKEKADEVGQMLEAFGELGDTDKRWLAIAKTDLQKGFMAWVRAVAQPESF